MDIITVSAKWTRKNVSPGKFDDPDLFSVLIITMFLFLDLVFREAINKQ